jgi:hydroxypyruvate isomerase
MAGIRPADVARASCLALFEQNLHGALAAADSSPVEMLLIEPINTRDIPGYVLNRPEEAAAIIERVGSDRLRLQYDFYHTQIMRGDVARGLETFWPLIGHVQVAGVPERQEPDIGELHCPYLFDCLDRLGYQGWVGAEYFPAGRTEDGLSWATRYGVNPQPTRLARGGTLV